MSNYDEPVCLATSAYRLPIPPLARAAIILVCWLPFNYLLNFSFPIAERRFEHLRETDLEKLPAFTQFLLWLGRLNHDLIRRAVDRVRGMPRRG